MKQYRVTSEHFVPQGEQGYPDAHMDNSDLVRMKQLAGILVKEDFYTAGGHDPAMDANAADKNMPSPVGSIPNKSDTDKRQIEREKHIKPGSDEWFKLWFSKPWLTGEKPVGDAPAPKLPSNKSNL